MRKFFAVSLILLLFSSPALAVLAKDSMNIYAVTTSGEGLVAKLQLEIEEGTGKIWSAVTPLVGTSTQQAERTAVRVAKEFFADADNYDYKYTISSSASVVEGPSAGAAMALLTIAMLTDRDIPDNVSITGTVREDSSIGPVGGVFEKAREAGQTGVRLFLIPRGESIQTVRLEGGVRSVNLVEYAPSAWDVKVAEVETIEDALVLAFSDVEKIDVNVSAQDAVPDFVPEKIRVPEHLGSFKILTSNYLRETRQVVGEARNALAGTLLEDPEVSSFLLSVLNDSEKTLSDAEILNEQNYLYSAANLGFLARVNAILVREIAANPSILNEDSSAFDLKLLELDRNLREFGKDLNGNIPKDGLEWFASAQQRFAYSKITLERLRAGNETPENAGEADRIRQRLESIRDYAFAVSWLGVSKDFYLLSLESNGLVAPLDSFEPEIGPVLAESESGLEGLGLETEREDIRRRIDASKGQMEMHWFESSFFDAVSARALVEAEAAMADKDNTELRELLESKILEAETKIAGSDVRTGWPVLFLDHAKYFLEASKYYGERELSISSANNLRSGIGLAFLSSELFDASDSVLRAYSASELLEPEKSPVETQERGSENLFLVGALLFFLAFSLILLLLLVVYVGRSSRSLVLESEIPRLRAMIRSADEKFLSGSMDADEHARIKGKYSSELGFLESQRKVKAGHVLAIDNYRGEIDSVNERLVALKKHFRGGLISKREFAGKSLEYLSRIDSYRRKLKEELGAVEKQKEFLRKINLEAIGSEKPAKPPSRTRRSLSTGKKSPAEKKDPASGGRARKKSAKSNG